MKYKYLPYDSNHYSTNLRRDSATGNLQWDHSPGQGVFIIQTPFGRKAEDYINTICEKLETISLERDNYTEVFPGVYLRFVSAAAKVRYRGCPLNGEASSYTVISCTDNAGEDNKSSGECYLYAPSYQAMVSPRYDVPLSIHIEISRQTKTEGLIFKREIPTDFYYISFPDNLRRNYNDGDLFYSVNGFTIPITEKMVQNRVIYIKSNIKPEVGIKNQGLKIV